MSGIAHILVVDNHPIARKTICALLRADPDFDVVCDATNGAEAVVQANCSCPQLCFPSCLAIYKSESGRGHRRPEGGRVGSPRFRPQRVISALEVHLAFSFAACSNCFTAAMVRAV